MQSKGSSMSYLSGRGGRPSSTNANGQDPTARSNPPEAIEVATTQDLGAPPAAVLAVAGDPETLPRWVVALRSLEATGRNRYRAEVGYFTYRRTFEARRLPSPPDVVLWECRDADLRIELQITATGLERNRSVVEFLARADGDDPFEGLAPTVEIGRLLVRSVASHSLSQLGRAAVRWSNGVAC